MSKIGKKPIIIPEGVAVAKKNTLVEITGPKGKISLEVNPLVEVEFGEGKITVFSRFREFWGLTHSLLNNAVEGVTLGFKKELVLSGVGFRAERDKENLKLFLGFSHPVVVPVPQAVSVNVEGGIKIIIEGADKEKVGQLAAKIRAIRPPEPYKGKGIKYADEVIRRKAGKLAKTAAAPA